jgi:hypothetical protein
MDRIEWIEWIDGYRRENLFKRQKGKNRQVVKEG